VAALEAALAGAPVVITEVGGTRDYFKDLADYAEYGSVDSICQGIERALARPQDGSLRDHVRQNFTWPNVGGKILELYKSLGLQ
jgi:glycosyltransferase involved in cell wall biosynthesis